MLTHLRPSPSPKNSKTSMEQVSRDSVSLSHLAKCARKLIRKASQPR